MKINKCILVLLVILIIVGVTGCLGSGKMKADSTPYLKDIITTYSGGKPMDIFEVYSDMRTRYRGDSVSVYDSPSQKKLLFYSTLDYTIKRSENHE